ncbi:MAG: hypothetical protein ABI811_23610 [Acidobacteriota bacterium]
MRVLAALLALVAVPAAWAQRPATSPTGFGRILFPGGGGPSASGTDPGYGRILYPGTGAPAVTRTSNIGNPVFVGIQSQPPQVQHKNHSTPVVIPYPVYYGGSYYSYDAPQAQLASNVIPVPYSVSAPQASEPAPVVIINQYFRADGPPVTETASSAGARVETAPQQQGAATNNDAPVFIIAMKDHTIFAANAYWVEDGTLNYITIQGSQNSASMDLVDREMSRRLNKDRNVSFGLPNN